MDKMNIKTYGVPDALTTAYSDFTIGRILAQEKGFYRVICETGEHLATVSGKLRYEAQSALDFPVVGDIVALAPENTIHSILPRKSVFLRKAAGAASAAQAVAANIDTVFLCMSLNQDFNLRRLERYLSIAWESGATPAIVLTKADLCDDIAKKLRAIESIAIGVDILITSSMLQDGYQQILPYIQQYKTVAFIGSSGVGKSTLINRLLGEDRLSTGGLRNDDKGRHTTTRRELILLPNGGLVLDTPGMRELGLWDTAEGLEKTFADIEALAQNCRFKNCSHSTEPGCAVRAALRSGTLSEARWRSYQKLKAENAYTENSESYRAAKRKKFKEIAKINKTKYKE